MGKPARPRRFAKFLRLSGARKICLVEVTLLLAAAQIMTRVLPFRWWSGLLGPVGKAVAVPAHPVPVQTCKDVRWAVLAATRHLPWTPVCLPQAMAGKWMLARRGVASILCSGIRKPDTGTGARDDLHAWLVVGGEGLIGGEIADQFQIIAQYGGWPQDN